MRLTQTQYLALDSDGRQAYLKEEINAMGVRDDSLTADAKALFMYELVVHMWTLMRKMSGRF